MQTGTIKKIIGPVVDVDFGENLPDIYSALEVMNGNKKIILEVEQHLGGGIVRTVAMDTTDGLARGIKVVNTGAPISVPVGSATLGRIFNVLGEAIDDGSALGSKESLKRSPIHRSAPEYVKQATKVEILETGIKVIDLICPVLKGGKVGLLVAQEWARQSSFKNSFIILHRTMEDILSLLGWENELVKATIYITK